MHALPVIFTVLDQSGCCCRCKHLFFFCVLCREIKGFLGEGDDEAHFVAKRGRRNDVNNSMRRPLKNQLVIIMEFYNETVECKKTADSPTEIPGHVLSVFLECFFMQGDLSLCGGKKSASPFGGQVTSFLVMKTIRRNGRDKKTSSP